MKVFEILREDIANVSEEQVAARLKAFNWKYEFADDFRKQARGEQEMQVLENMVYQLWKNKPERAVKLWNESCPGADAGTTPSFIFRLQAQE